MRARSNSAGAIAFLAALLMLLAPSGAAAATVVNGDFESGNLRGWQVHRAIQAGNWFAYEGTNAPIGSKRGANPVQPPPQGDFAAIVDQANPDTLILYQDVVLEPGRSHRLGMIVYYDSYAPIATPTPDTLSVDEEVLAGQSNQQYRIDVMRPDAPLESLAPADILDTVFRTKKGDPARLSPTRVTADLTRFAGQTVRLRISSAVTEEVFNAGLDAVSISGSGGGQGGSPSGGSKGGSDPVQLRQVQGEPPQRHGDASGAGPRARAADDERYPAFSTDGERDQGQETPEADRTRGYLGSLGEDGDDSLETASICPRDPAAEAQSPGQAGHHLQAGRRWSGDGDGASDAQAQARPVSAALISLSPRI